MQGPAGGRGAGDHVSHSNGICLQFYAFVLHFIIWGQTGGVEGKEIGIKCKDSSLLSIPWVYEDSNFPFLLPLWVTASTVTWIWTPLFVESDLPESYTVAGLDKLLCFRKVHPLHLLAEETNAQLGCSLKNFPFHILAGQTPGAKKQVIPQEFHFGATEDKGAILKFHSRGQALHLAWSTGTE